MNTVQLDHKIMQLYHLQGLEDIEDDAVLRFADFLDTCIEQMADTLNGLGIKPFDELRFQLVKFYTSRILNTPCLCATQFDANPAMAALLGPNLPADEETRHSLYKSWLGFWASKGMLIQHSLGDKDTGSQATWLVPG